MAIEVADLELLTREDVIEFYDKFIASKAPERRKLAVHVTSTLETDEENSGVYLMVFEEFSFRAIIFSFHEKNYFGNNISRNLFQSKKLQEMMMPPNNKMILEPILLVTVSRM